MHQLIRQPVPRSINALLEITLGLRGTDSLTCLPDRKTAIGPCLRTSSVLPVPAVHLLCFVLRTAPNCTMVSACFIHRCEVVEPSRPSNWRHSSLTRYIKWVLSRQNHRRVTRHPAIFLAAENSGNILYLWGKSQIRDTRDTCKTIEHMQHFFSL